MENRTAKCRKDHENKNDNKSEKLLLDNNTHAIVRTISETKVQIGLTTQNKDTDNDT